MINYPNGVNAMIDLDAEQGRTGGRTSNTFRLVVRSTKTVNLAVLNTWLQGRTSYNENVAEALSMCRCIFSR
jgi:eukaryotic translation initiation factor 2C